MAVDPLERITNLIALLLATRVPLTQDRIVHELDRQYPTEPQARRAAFERDKAALRAEGIRIEQTYLADGATGYWIDRSQYELGDLGLSTAEQQALQLAAATVHLGVDWAGDALHKVAPSADAVAGPAGPATAVLGSLPALAPLFAANANRSTVTFTYRGRTRRLDPFGLLSRSGNWYVVGHDHDRGALRNFRVDRIESEVSTGDPGAFEVPDGFDPATALADDMKAVGPADSDPSEATEALVWVARGWARRVVAELGESAVVAADEAAGEPGDVVVRVPCANRPAFRSWVLGLLEHAVVLEPVEVRDEVVAWLEGFR
jgi:proteasome accessory factor B